VPNHAPVSIPRYLFDKTGRRTTEEATKDNGYFRHSERARHLTSLHLIQKLLVDYLRENISGR